MGDKWVGAGSGKQMPVRTMVVLTLPTLALAAAATLVVYFLPVIIKGILGEDHPNLNLLIGFAIGGEGIFCALIPLWVGVQSDRIWTKRWGRRRPFMIFAAPFMAATLMLAPFQKEYVPLVVATFIFFAGYHFYSSPYLSLMHDSSPASFHGRVQGFQGAMRGFGMFGIILIAAALFDYLSRYEIPFLLCGTLLMVATYITVVKIGEVQPILSEQHTSESVWRAVGRIWKTTIRDKTIRRFMAAAFLWEATLAGIKPFILFYFLETLGASIFAAGLMFGLVAIVYIIAGLGGGYLADRYGRNRIMRIGLWLYLCGAILGTIIDDIKWAYVLMPIFGLGGSVVLTLPYAILMGIMPKEQVGGLTAMFSMVRGVAVAVAPLVAGLAVDVTKGLLDGTRYAGREYAAIWVVCGLLIVISLFVFRNRDKTSGNGGETEATDGQATGSPTASE